MGTAARRVTGTGGGRTFTGFAAAVARPLERCLEAAVEALGDAGGEMGGGVASSGALGARLPGGGASDYTAAGTAC